MENIMTRFKAGETRALARIITLLENLDPDREDLLKELFFLAGKAYVLGFTGSPGAGKSSLVDRVVKMLRLAGQSVGIIAVDPSSPFTGGALLGDRVRMQDHALDKGVFIRSMGTRGNLGGLAMATKEVVTAMDAFGFDWVIIETVGVGQAELDIMHVADTTVVVLTPGAGGAVQTIKAGIMEIADVFAVNKCDLPGSDKVVTEVRMMLEQKPPQNGWKPPVIPVSSLTGQGVEDLVKDIRNHRAYLADNGILDSRRTERTRTETLDITIHKWRQQVLSQLELPGQVNELLDKVAAREMDPYTAANKILAHVKPLKPGE